MHDYFAIFVPFDSIYTDFNRKIAFMAQKLKQKEA